MSNRFREELTSGEVEREAQPEIKQDKTELPRSFFTAPFTNGVITKESATEMLPFIVFLAFLSMIYIGNKHLTERSIRDIDKLNREVKELTWDFKTLKADLMQRSTQSEVAKYADSLGLKESVEPPKKLVVNYQ